MKHHFATLLIYRYDEISLGRRIKNREEIFREVTDMDIKLEQGRDYTDKYRFQDCHPKQFIQAKTKSKIFAHT